MRCTLPTILSLIVLAAALEFTCTAPEVGNCCEGVEIDSAGEPIGSSCTSLVSPSPLLAIL